MLEIVPLLERILSQWKLTSSTSSQLISKKQLLLNSLSSIAFAQKSSGHLQRLSANKSCGTSQRRSATSAWRDWPALNSSTIPSIFRSADCGRCGPRRCCCSFRRAGRQLFRTCWYLSSGCDSFRRSWSATVIRREGLVIFSCDCHLHELNPYWQRSMRARLLLTERLPIVVANPHTARYGRRKSKKPCICKIVRRPRLAAKRMIQRRCRRTRASADNFLQKYHHRSSSLGTRRF